MTNGVSGIINEAAVVNFDGYGNAILHVNINQCAIEDNTGSGLVNRSIEGGGQKLPSATATSAVIKA